MWFCDLSRMPTLRDCACEFARQTFARLRGRLAAWGGKLSGRLPAGKDRAAAPVGGEQVDPTAGVTDGRAAWATPPGAP